MDQLFEFLLHHVSEDTKKELERVLDMYDGHIKDVLIEYMPYDWSSNEDV